MEKRKRGRPKGSKTKRTVELALKAAAEGITPLEVMLSSMRTLWAAGKAAEAAALAKDAAPYIHPRLSSVEAKHEVNLRNLSEDAIDQRIAELVGEVGIAVAAHGEATTH